MRGLNFHTESNRRTCVCLRRNLGRALKLYYDADVPRLTKRRAIVAICLLGAVAFLSLVAYGNQFRIRASIWHALHGDTLAVGGYRVRVPSDWFVKQSSSDEVFLWNLRTWETISFRPSMKRPNSTLESFSDAVQKRVNGPELQIVGKRDVRFGGESFVCFEWDAEANVSVRKSPQTVHLPVAACEGSMGVIFSGVPRRAHVTPLRDYQDFYSLMASIQKQ